MKNNNLYYTYVIDFKQIRDESLLQFLAQLNDLYDILKTGITKVLESTIQFDSFSDLEYENKYKAHFKKALAQKTNKFYLNWDLSQKERAFRMLSEFLRQNFKSLLYKQQITEILAQHQFDLSHKKEIREALLSKSLFPTQSEINNLCRSKKIINKEYIKQKETEGIDVFKLTLDYTSQDKQTIKQPDLTLPVYEIYNFNKAKASWFSLDLSSYLPLFFIEKVNNLKQNDLFVKYTKPNFFKNKKGEWNIAITIEFKPEKNQLNQQRICGVDLGRVHPIVGMIIQQQNNKTKNFNTATVLSEKILCKKEAVKVKEKLDKVTKNLHQVYSKLNHYHKVLERFDMAYYVNENPNRISFIQNIQHKQQRLILEKKYLRHKAKELRKRLAYLAARDLIKQLKRWNVGLVKFERLNWVEYTGGKWDFSQMRQIIEYKLAINNISFMQVNAAKTSSQNPFRQKNDYGKKRSDRFVYFKNYKIDRDELGAVNVALRDKKLENKIILDFNKTLKQKRMKIELIVD